MPAALLFSTSDVPCIEAPKTKLRFDGRGNNNFFAGQKFFATPKFAGSYSTLVKLLAVGATCKRS